MKVKFQAGSDTWSSQATWSFFSTINIIKIKMLVWKDFLFKLMLSLCNDYIGTFAKTNIQIIYSEYNYCTKHKLLYNYTVIFWKIFKDFWRSLKILKS